MLKTHTIFSANYFFESPYKNFRNCFLKFKLLKEVIFWEMTEQYFYKSTDGTIVKMCLPIHSIDENIDIGVPSNKLSTLANVETLIVNIFPGHKKYWGNTNDNTVLTDLGKLLNELVIMKPRSHIKLKHFTLLTRGYRYCYNTPCHTKRVCIGIIHALGKLNTKPIVVWDTCIPCFPTTTFSSIGEITELGYISKLYCTRNDYKMKQHHLLEMLFNMSLIENTFIIDVGLLIQKMFFGCDESAVHDITEYNIVRPTDVVEIAKSILNMNVDQLNAGNTPSLSLIPKHPVLAWQIRYNSDLIRNYSNICTMLFMNFKFGERNPIKIKGNMYKKNYWAWINKDILRLLLNTYIHPRDWEIKDTKKRKGRLTVKSPKWATDSIKQFKNYQSTKIIEYNIKQQLNSKKKELKKVQKRKKKLPTEIKLLEHQLEEENYNIKQRTTTLFEFLKESKEIQQGIKKRRKKSRNVGK